MSTKRESKPSLRDDDRLLTYGQAAEIFNTSPRFPRRLVEERRIRFVRVGRFIRIPESAVREYIAAGLVEPISLGSASYRRAA
ncbi:excisionase family DNA-binding protein [Spirillospora sp. NPDC127200]